MKYPSHLVKIKNQSEIETVVSSYDSTMVKEKFLESTPGDNEIILFYFKNKRIKKKVGRFTTDELFEQEPTQPEEVENIPEEES